MQLTNDHISTFQALYQKHFGIALTEKEALEKGLRLIRLMEVVLRESADMTNSPVRQ